MTKNVGWWCHVTMWSCNCHMTHMYFREHNPFLPVSVVLNYDNICQLILSGKLLQKVYVVNTFSRSQADSSGSLCLSMSESAYGVHPSWNLAFHTWWEFKTYNRESPWKKLLIGDAITSCTRHVCILPTRKHFWWHQHNFKNDTISQPVLSRGLTCESLKGITPLDPNI